MSKRKRKAPQSIERRRRMGSRWVSVVRPMDAENLADFNLLPEDNKSFGDYTVLVRHGGVLLTKAGESKGDPVDAFFINKKTFDRIVNWYTTYVPRRWPSVVKP